MERPSGGLVRIAGANRRGRGGAGGSARLLLLLLRQSPQTDASAFAAQRRLLFSEPLPVRLKTGAVALEDCVIRFRHFFFYFFV